ncbi:Glutamate dehydrogenase A [Monoraphidium neglectum]|uniref:Glutamate dehydrogenase A n=1 Tax=Monoraphidium neglectum TaxID=145388 RepID=A0A0D2KI24_9CHLO|nr:Glutamate dehydrogenase A [Monoraphidium neglectum]KIY95463.1 Glutamate dehydrogenase A [Monoraphidium neglectum]|eukprot:XP_013894483.1 Glutamate dehydrogenase A [Monoraphidium neglectum]
MLRLLAQRGSWAALQAAAGPALPRALQLAKRLTASWAGPFGDSSPQRNQPENQTQSEKAAVSHFVSEAMEMLDMSPGLQRAILNPDRSLSVELMVPMDNGGVEIIMAHRVQHNNSRGPYKGGFKYHPEADLADTEA